MRDHNRSDHDNGEVERPVTACGEGVGLRPGFNGGQFGRVEPGQRQPGSAEEAHVEEKAEDGALGALGITGN